MATQKQINANRRNAKRSTGPRTPEGKRRVSKNALKHGFTSADVVLPSEDPAEFERLRDGFVEALDPRDEVELALVRQMASAEWRLRRVDRIESATVRHCIRLRKPNELRDQTDRRIPGTPDQIEALLADICFYAECVQGDAISKYARYASVYGRQFHRAHKLLQERPAETEMEPEPDVSGPEETETDRTKPTSGNRQGNQLDTAICTKPDEPHGPPKPAHNPGNQPREGRQ